MWFAGSLHRVPLGGTLPSLAKANFANVAKWSCFAGGAGVGALSFASTCLQKLATSTTESLERVWSRMPRSKLLKTFSEWAGELESISSVEIALENMCEGENSRETTEYGIMMCAKRILERGWIQTSPFVWKWKTQEDADRFCFLISSRQEITTFFQNQKINFASGLGAPLA